MMEVDQYLPILGLLILGVLFASGSLVMSSGVGAAQATKDAKLAPYECGIVPENADRRSDFRCASISWR
jgi:NADH:ubiquinone oxidoreductase subunit 3 (subunit A)